MNTHTRETCWFCAIHEADPFASIIEKLYRGEKGDWEIREVSIPRCSNCQKVHTEIASVELVNLQPQFLKGKQIQIMSGIYVPLSSFLIWVLVGGVVVGGFLLLGYTSDPVLSCVITGGILLAGVVLWGIIGGIKEVRARNQLLNDLGIKDKATSIKYPDVLNLIEEGWKIGEPPLPKKPPATEPIPVKPVATSAPRRKPSKYSENDGYLLPEYWRCIVCKACKTDKRAAQAVRVTVFLKAIDDERFFLELDQTDRAAIKKYTSYLAHPQGALMARPPGTDHLEDTSGLAHDMTGWGFDAVYLCDAHTGELKLSIEIPKKREKKTGRKGVGGKPNDQKEVSPKRVKKHVERTAPNLQSVRTEQKGTTSLKEEKEIRTKPYQPGQEEPEEYIHYIGSLLKQKIDCRLDQIVVLVGFYDHEAVNEILDQIKEIDLHTDHVKVAPQFGHRNPLIELRYDDSIDQNLVEFDARALKGWGATDISAVGISQETLREFQYWYGEKSCPFLVARPE